MCSPTPFVWQCNPLAQGNFGLPRGRMLPMEVGWQGGLGKRKKRKAMVGFEPLPCAWSRSLKTNQLPCQLIADNVTFHNTSSDFFRFSLQKKDLI